MFKDKNVNVDFVEEEHGAVYNFFLVTGGNFFKLIITNIMFVFFNLPSIALAFFYTSFILPMYSPNFELNKFHEFWSKYGLSGNPNGFVPNDVSNFEATNELYFLLILMLALFLVGTTIFSIVPLQAGFSQIYRNLYRRDIVSVWNDFKTGIKNNFKQSLWVTGISLLITVILGFAIGFYWNMEGKFATFSSTLLLVVFFLFISIQNMVYQMVVSVKLPLRKIYQNALLLFLIKPLKSFLLLILEVFLFLGLPLILIVNSSYTAYSIVLIGYTTILFSFIHFALSYYSCSMIDKYVISNETKRDNVDENEIVKDDSSENVKVK